MHCIMFLFNVIYIYEHPSIRIITIIIVIICYLDNGSIIRRWRWRLGKVAVGIFKSYAPAVVLWKSIMPVGGRVAGKGVGVHNSGGSSDGKY
jgi:hypothetical protein